MQEASLRPSHASTSSVENLGSRVTPRVTPRSRLMIDLDFAIRHGKMVAIDAIADPEWLVELELAVLDG